MINEMIHTPTAKTAEFLQSVLETAEKRRDSVENKASILLASNAILLTAIGPFALSASTILGIVDWVRITSVLIALLGVAISSICAVVVLARPPMKLRQTNIPASGFDVVFFGRIAEHKNAATYLSAVQSLTEEQILDQLATEAHNLSNILVYRYKWFEHSHRAFILGILAFAFLAVLKLLG